LYNQAKTVSWDVVKQFARPVLASPPNEAELRVDLLGGSRISFYGGDNGDGYAGWVSTVSCWTNMLTMDSRASRVPADWGHGFAGSCALADAAAHARF
jgi:hypothetical protein